MGFDMVTIIHGSLLSFRLIDTFEKKSREVSAELSNDQGYPQARKLSDAAAWGLEGEEGDEEGEDTAKGGEQNDNQQAEPVSSEDDDVI